MAPSYGRQAQEAAALLGRLPRGGDRLVLLRAHGGPPLRKLLLRCAAAPSGRMLLGCAAAPSSGRMLL
eukprot:4124726-Prymnesium_polylepis.1